MADISNYNYPFIKTDIREIIMTAENFNNYINKLLAGGAKISRVGENFEISYTKINGDCEDDVFINFPKNILKMIK